MVERWGRRAAGLMLLLPVLVWVVSIGALVEAMRANEAAGLLARQHGAGVRVEHLRGVAVMWCVVLAGLQVGAGLAGASVLRGVYRVRAVASFAVSAVSVILLNGVWLVGLLVWLRVYGDLR